MHRASLGNKLLGGASSRRERSLTGRARAGLFAAFLIVALVFLRAAWVSDDAYISLRVLDNALHGTGLRWNPLERVQVYTHPLWLLVLALPYAITRETLWTVSVVGIATTLLALGLASRRLLGVASVERILVFLLLCVSSRSVVSYASSGLENPLSLLLLVLLVERCDPDRAPLRPTWTIALASLIALTRIDLVLVAFPLVYMQLRRLPWTAALRAMLLGGLPFLAWELFSLVYYGALVPNTALAKLGTGIDHLMLARQGLRYFVALLRWDTVGAAVLACGIIVAGLGRSRALALGLLAYLGYIVWIGGDFMCGRFFAVPIALSALALCEARLPRRGWVALLTLPVLLFLSVEGGPWRWLRSDEYPEHYWGVIDERAFYTRSTGLLDPRRPRDLAEQAFARAGLDARHSGVRVEGCIGMFGYYAGRSVEIIDPMALADPLLARLPIDDTVHFRIGHFQRELPAGYEQSVIRGVNVIADPQLARYWDAIQLVTRGPLWSGARWRAIYELSTGRLDALRDAYVARRREALRTLRPQ